MTEQAIELPTMEPKTIDLYCDGGVILKNPSPLGGTWAFRAIVRSGVMTHWEDRSGYINPDLGVDGKVTNNVAEMVAAIEALAWAYAVQLPKPVITLHSDSQVTLNRLFKGWGMTGIPDWLTHRISVVRHSSLFFIGARPVLLAGHPTQEDLNRGMNAKGTPVSIHNVWADKRCQEIAAKALEALPQETIDAIRQK